MISDSDLDQALGQLGTPAGAEPRTDAAAILARARLFAAPPAPPRPRVLAPVVGAGLLAAGLLAGVGLGRVTAPAAPPADPATVVVNVPVIVPVPVYLPAPAEPADAAPGASVPDDGGERIAEGRTSPSRSAPRAPEAAPRHATAPLPDEPPAAPAPLLAATPAPAEPVATCVAAVDPAGDPARTPAPGGGTAADRELAELLAEELPTAVPDPDSLDDATALPGAADRRMVRPERQPREPGEGPPEPEAVAETDVITVPGRKAGEALPLDLRVVAAGGASPGEDRRAGGEGAVGIAWRPALPGFSRPEVALDVGAGGWSSDDRVDWRLRARASVGLVLGNGVVRPAVDWSVVAGLALAEPQDPGRDGRPALPEGPSPFATGPALAVVFGRDTGVRGRLGAQLDLGPRLGAPTAGWELHPEAFVALELPLGRSAVD